MAKAAADSTTSIGVRLFPGLPPIVPLIPEIDLIKLNFFYDFRLESTNIMKCKKYLDEIDNNISLKKILIVNFVQANAVLIKVCLLSRNSIFIKVARYNPPLC